MWLQASGKNQVERFKNPKNVWKLGPLPDSVLRAQERAAKAANLDVIKSFYRLLPLERAVIEALLKEVRGNRLALTINFKTSSPLLLESLDKIKPVPPNLKGRRPPEMTLAEDTLSRLTYYHRPVFRDEIRGRGVEWRTHWLSGYAELGYGLVLISLEERILPHLKLLKNYLARRSFTARFTSQYSVRLYEWAWQHRKAGLMRLSVEELREILGVNEEKDDRGRVVRQAILTHWPNLKQRALTRALNEVTAKSDLEVKLVTSYRGEMHKVVALVFEVKVKAGESRSAGEGQK
jgi:hypothetical protein